MLDYFSARVNVASKFWTLVRCRTCIDQINITADPRGFSSHTCLFQRPARPSPVRYCQSRPDSDSNMSYPRPRPVSGVEPLGAPTVEYTIFSDLPYTTPKLVVDGTSALCGSDNLGFRYDEGLRIDLSHIEASILKRGRSRTVAGIWS